MRPDAQLQPLMVGDAGWGNIDDVLNAPPLDITGDSTWLSVILMWLTLPINLIQGILGGLFGCVLTCYSLGCCCIPCSGALCSVLGLIRAGRPFCLAWNLWRYALSLLLALVANGKSRLGLFLWEWKAFGSGEFFFHGEGIWSVGYAACDKIMRSPQPRRRAFGCFEACTPDLFPERLLIFLPNTGGADSEWATIRRVLHATFLEQGSAAYMDRIKRIPQHLAADRPTPTMNDFNDLALLQKVVAKCIFFVMFGKWVADMDAEVLTGWRSHAAFFVLPRLVQRFMFNYGINKVKALRRDSIRIVEKYGEQGLFHEMNNQLGSWRRDTPVRLCDEIMYAVGFAGIGGTCASVEAMASFLQAKIPAESAAKHIHFGVYDTPEKMVVKYRANPEAYVRETLRLAPPVTSATSVLAAPVRARLAGADYDFPAGSLNQYTLSMANRDASVFPQPEIFNPDRPNLVQALTWNGAFGAPDESAYPRICPGRYLSLEITLLVVNHFLGIQVPEAKPTMMCR